MRNPVTLNVGYDQHGMTSDESRRPYVVVKVVNSTEVNPGDRVSRAWIDERIRGGWTVNITRYER